MALRFFRRRQKLVIVVMVLLMVAFLVPTGIRGLFERNPLKQVIGGVGKEKITLGTLRAAQRDLELLTGWLGLGQSRTPRRGERVFAHFLNRQQDHALSWTLLLHEAREMGIRADGQQVSEFLARSGYEGKSYQALLTRLSGMGHTEKHLRQAVANYLLVVEAFESAVVFTPPSVPELRHSFRDLRERMRLAMVTFPAEDFFNDVQDPSEQEIREWFEKHKSHVPDHAGNPTDFRFGYRLPDRLDVAYLFIDSERVEQAVEPSRDEMWGYWSTHKGQLTKEVAVIRPAPTTTQATSGPATRPTTAPAETQTTQPAEPEYRQVVIEKFSEAVPQIRQILKAQVAETKMSELLTRAEVLIDRHAEGEHPYAQAAADMIRPADALLARPVKRLPFRTAPLEMLINRLAEDARVKIVYPFGEHGTWSLDETVKVEVDPEWSKLTLGAVLAKVSAAHKYPEFQWVTCEGFESVIFPSAPIDLVPVSSGQTGKVSFDELFKHELLGAAAMTKEPSEGDPTLLSIAASARQFQGPEPRQTPLVEVGGDFRPALYVSGVQSGRLLWRLVTAERAHTPEALTEEIRRQVVEDLKIAKGFEKAKVAAEAMKAKLGPAGDLEKLAEQGKLQVVKTDSLARKTAYYQGIGWSLVPGVGVSPHFIQEAFDALAPEDPEPPHTDRPTAVVALPDQRKVLLVQRIEYSPAVSADFDEEWPFVAAMLIAQQRQRELFGWFAGPAIVRRVGFVQKSPAG